MKYLPIDQRLFVRNRDEFRKRMKPNSVAIFLSNDEMPRSADGHHDWRQNSDIFYLSGIDQEKSVLVLTTNCPRKDMQEILFLRETNDHIRVWEGHKYTQSEAIETSGIDRIYWLDQMGSTLGDLINMAENVYLNLNEHARYDSEVPYKDLRFARETKERYPLHRFHRSAPILTDLRSVKHRYEVELLQEACDITAHAFDRVMKFIQPGVSEYEIEAEIVHEFLRRRATGPAYHSIIASGKNACILHYNVNNQVCNAGDLILMDFGAEYANYCADLTRTIPVSGRFTKRQKEVYEAVLHVQKEATKLLVPGTLVVEYHKEVGKIMESQLKKIGLLTADDIANQDPSRPAYKKYFPHGTSHHLGLDVHDVGNKYKPIQAGMVFTVEPGIYIEAEGLGIRIENDVVVTDKHPLDLMAHIPREVEEIEEIMNSQKVDTGALA